jgi:hypothetical protein
MSATGWMLFHRKIFNAQVLGRVPLKTLQHPCKSLKLRYAGGATSRRSKFSGIFAPPAPRERSLFWPLAKETTPSGSKANLPSDSFHCHVTHWFPCLKVPMARGIGEAIPLPFQQKLSRDAPLRTRSRMKFWIHYAH